MKGEERNEGLVGLYLASHGDKLNRNIKKGMPKSLRSLASSLAPAPAAANTRRETDKGKCKKERKSPTKKTAPSPSNGGRKRHPPCNFLKNKSSESARYLFIVALQVGLEPTASRLEVSRATIAPLKGC
jgi:hypothetical protein